VLSPENGCFASVAPWEVDQWKARHIRTLRGHEFEITPVKKRKKKVTADGEVSSRTPAVIRLVPRVLSVFVPPAASA